MIVRPSPGRRGAGAGTDGAVAAAGPGAAGTGAAEAGAGGALAGTLTRLGWTVETGGPTAKGTQLDVVVTEV